MLFTTFIVRSPMFPVAMAVVDRHTTFVAARGGFTIATKWQPLVVAPLLEIVFWCLKHYLRITVCRNSAYMWLGFGLEYRIL